MIRSVSEPDIPRCAEVIRESFKTVADELEFTLENAPRFTAFAVTEERLIYQLNEENRHMYIFVSGGDIIGYFSLLVQAEGVCELNNLCVLPERRQEGIGAKLLWYAFETAEELGCSKMDIGIVEENRVLRRWYEGFGFVHTGVKKFDFFPFTCGYMEKIL
ncbi:GNAT family N-acetyltransferase [Acutalibacter sp. 1XD8-36]|uniref:GNAT family N-acetyltransferase n=1 Tax=Acutalibacter sp. 1XD8-36 TaxID=2320852 RepID=UPI001411C4BB|nr:GNAT family N-acetyltransferase [Acutalibacter sp. 1XD8-36]NBJ88772.1 GNAT family N-acetyltransferase [Acutalibacter sp. 1XD8-36]